MSDRIRLLIADDHPIVRSGLRGMLDSQSDFEVVAEAKTGYEVVALANLHPPDVVVMDLRMPEMDGACATTKIKSVNPRIRVLVLTTFESDSDILRAIEAGADGYLLKDAPPEQIFGAIRSAWQGDSPLSPAVATRLVKHLRTGTEEALSKREIEILMLLLDGASNKDIAEELWITEPTVKSHLKRIFEKLSVKDRTAAVVAALKSGIIRLDG